MKRKVKAMVLAGSMVLSVNNAYSQNSTWDDLNVSEKQTGQQGNKQGNRRMKRGGDSGGNHEKMQRHQGGQGGQGMQRREGGKGGQGGKEMQRNQGGKGGQGMQRHQGGEGGKGGQRGDKVKKFISSLSEEEREQLKKLRTENPDAFREEMKKKVDKFRAENKEKQEKRKALIAEYKKASSEEKQVIRSKVTDMVSQEFNEIMKANRFAYDKTSERVNDMKNKIDKREESSEQIIKDRVDSLLRDPDLKW